MNDDRFVLVVPKEKIHHVDDGEWFPYVTRTNVALPHGTECEVSRSNGQLLFRSDGNVMSRPGERLCLVGIECAEEDVIEYPIELLLPA